MATDNPVMRANQRAQDRAAVQPSPGVTETIAGTRASIADAANQAQSDLAVLEGLQQQSVESVRATSAAEQVLKLQVETENLAHQNRMQETLEGADVFENLQRNMNTLDALHEENRESFERIDAINNTPITGIGFIDNPLQAIKRRGHEERIALNNQEIKSITMETNAVSQARNEATSVSGQMRKLVTQETINANLRMIQEKAKQQELANKAEFLDHRASTLQRAVTANMQGMQVMIQDQAHREGLIRDGSEQEKYDVAMRANKGVIYEDWIAIINSERKRTGLEPLGEQEGRVSFEQFKKNETLWTKKTPELAKNLRDGTLGVKANSAEEAAEIVLSGGNLGNPQLQAMVANAVADSKASGTESHPQAAARLFRDRAAKAAKSIEAGDTNNPFVANTQAIAMNEHVTSTPFWQKVVGTHNLDVADHQQVAEHAWRSLKDGTITKEEYLQGMQSIYRQAEIQANTVMDLNSIGEAQVKGYRAKVNIQLRDITKSLTPFQTLVPGVAAFNISQMRSEVLDLTTEAGLERLLLKYELLNNQGITE